MREILFRGKRIIDNEWIEGFYFKAKCYITDEELSDYISIPHREEKCRPSETFMVWHETVGQFTGLTDKNGKKIFEGDIVKYGDTVHEVVFEQRNGTAYFGLVYNELETLPFGHYQDLRQIEVIGNIHDNPELLNLRR